MVCELRVSLSITLAELPAALRLLLLLLETLLTLLLLTSVVFLPEPSTPNSLSALSLTHLLALSLSEEGVIDWLVRLRWEVCSQCGGGLHLSQRQSIATPLLPFKAPHSRRQTGGGRKREVGGGET